MRFSNAFSVGRVPAYRRHKPSGQAVVTLCGRDYYLGKWKTKASRREYDRLVGQWLAGGRCLPRPEDTGPTVAELCAAYWNHARTYYRKDGQPTGSIDRIRVAIRAFREHHTDTLAAEVFRLPREMLSLSWFPSHGKSDK